MEGNLKQVKYLQTLFLLSFIDSALTPAVQVFPLRFSTPILRINILLKIHGRKLHFLNSDSQTFIIFVLENDVSILHSGGLCIKQNQWKINDTRKRKILSLFLFIWRCNLSFLSVVVFLDALM